MKRFLLVTEGLNEQGVRGLAAALQPPVGWFHQIPALWVIADPTDQYTCEVIVGIVQGIDPDAECIVLRVDEVREWKGRLRLSDDGRESAMDWMRRFALEPLQLPSMHALPHDTEPYT